jgi:hypothetical protein
MHTQKTAADGTYSEKWYRDGQLLAPGFHPGIPHGWSQAPPGSTGYAEGKLTKKFKIKIPVTESVRTIWVKVTSTAEVTGWGSGSRTCTASNGQGDEALDNGAEVTSSGSHLRKVNLNANGEGEWTVTMSGKSVGVGTSYNFGGGLGASLVRDPRVISLPLVFKKKETPEVTEPVDIESAYQKLVDHPLTHLGSVYANIPKGQSFPIHFTFGQAEREVVHPESTDALSLKMDAKIAFPVQPIVWQYNESGGVTGLTGTAYRDVSWFAEYLGSPAGSTPVWFSATHNGVLNANASEASAGSISAVSHLLVDSLVRRAYQHKRPTSKVDSGDTSGSFNAKFSWFDGVDGTAEVKFTYAHVTESVAKHHPKEQVFPSTASVLTFYSPVVPGWQTDDDYSATVLPGYQNDLMALNVGIGVTGALMGFFCPEAVVTIMMISAIESGIGGLLDSTSEYGKVSRLFQRRDNERFWKLDNVGSLTRDMFDGAEWSAIVPTCKWRLEAAAYHSVVYHVRDIYNESGFLKRGASPEWSAPALEDTTNISRFYHYWYESQNGGQAP